MISSRSFAGRVPSTRPSCTTSASSSPAGTSMRRMPTAKPGRFSTITSPRRSTIEPRAATILSEWRRWSFACAMNSEPLRICRNHSLNRMMPNSTTAMPTMMATRSATDGSWMMGLSRRPVRIGRSRRPARLPCPSSTETTSPTEPEAHDQVQRRRQQRVEDERRDEHAAQEEAERRLPLEQELGHGEQYVGEQSGGEGADQWRVAGRKVGGLGIAAGEEPGEYEDERAQAERLHERDGHERAREKAEHGADLGAREQGDADDDDQREIGVGAEDADVGRHRGLQQRRHHERDHETGDLAARRPLALPVVGGGAGEPHRTTTWTRSSLRKSTNGSSEMLWYSSTSWLPTLSIWPTGMPRTKTEPWRPEVTTYWPTLTRSFLSTYCSVTSPVTLPEMMPWAPPCWTMASTKLCWSVMSVSRAALASTFVTRPTRPAPLTTGSYTSTPLLLPTSMVTVEYQAVVERATTRAVTSRTPSG